ncbi:MAG: hypothetical protein OWU33_04245 [Firmicutes bacterium]|nr:hypothetical protein [Bacillota bacterium]
MQPFNRIIVVGRGPAGLYASALALSYGMGVTLIADGVGTLPLWGGHWDFVTTDDQGSFVSDPWAWWENVPPVPGAEPVTRAEWRAWWGTLVRLWDAIGIPVDDTPRRNRWLMTPLGTLRPVFLTPKWHWIQEDPGAVTVVGFRDFLDFPVAVAAHTYAQETGASVHTVLLDRPPQWSSGWQALHWAWYFDSESGRNWLLAQLEATRFESRRPVVFPQILGVDRTETLLGAMENVLEVPVAEVPLTPPAIGGFRIQRRWERWLRRRGLRFIHGHVTTATPTSVQLHDGRVLEADVVVLATGGVLGGGIRIQADGSAHDPVTGVSMGRLSAPHDLGVLGYPAGETGMAVVGRQLGGRDADRQGVGGALILWSVHRVWRSVGIQTNQEGVEVRGRIVGRVP